VRVGRRILVLAAVGLVLAAGPAAADAAKPGNFESEVTAVEPDVPGFSIEIVGGDAFLSLDVDEGHEVVVEGYSGEPYLRVLEDGTVERNTNSPATYINDSRYGNNSLLPAELEGIDPTTLDPAWAAVGDGGHYVWHDHRTHYMGSGTPQSEWEVPMTVDGTELVVHGTLTEHDELSPLPWLVLALALAAGLALAGDRIPDRAAAAAVAAGALAATVVAWVGYTSLPSGTGPSIVPFVVGVVAFALAGLALVASSRVGTVSLLAAGVFLTTWGVFRFSVLTNPILPTSVPFAVERLTTAVALGLGVGAVIRTLRSGALTISLMPLDE
jgi:hypothetical protein